jgi:hypothetical protein
MKLDPVDQKALKGSLKSAKDKDINDDGKVNSSDEYLHKRRQAVSKALGKLKEETLDEKKLSDKDVKRALASAKAQAKPKETVSLKKPPFKMDEEVEELDEVSASTLGSYIRKASKGKEAAYKSREEVELDENIAGKFKDSSEWEQAAKSRGLVVKSMTHPSGEATKYQIAKDKEGNNRGHFDHGTKSGHLKEAVELDEAKKPKPGHNAMVMSKNISKVLAAMKKEETASSKDIILAAMSSDETDDASTIAKHTKPLRMKLAHFRHEE